MQEICRFRQEMWKLRQELWWLRHRRYGSSDRRCDGLDRSYIWWLSGGLSGDFMAQKEMLWRPELRLTNKQQPAV